MPSQCCACSWLISSPFTNCDWLGHSVFKTQLRYTVDSDVPKKGTVPASPSAYDSLGTVLRRKVSFTIS